ncbi:hypothetical protein CYFUS_008801 [Cystobacter fuscus]|uniref:Peptidase M12A domain-containing protein n=1 Tax=Cystobacter fuscus TaxID=43 RepID=A0A250JIV7_9BACT|nr:hypothetical protein [Cystobacter fuscus]ATB43321.1 hypothetical protein CYFUS_008801 [Cystobacter fuscus]
MRFHRLWASAALLGAALAAPDARASLYWYNGVRGATPSVCFVGDALSSQPARVQQVLEYIGDFERAANIRFNYLGTCPAPIVLSNGNDWYGGDIRVVLPSTSVPFTGAVPGQGCPMFLDANGQYTGENNGWGSWSNAPDDLTANRGCRYNLKLGSDADASGVPWRNHTLHEFGHALGLAHEHVRDDVNTATCTAAGYGGTASAGHITLYDRQSVMHYAFSTCGIDGNYGQDGLSALDRLGLHIMYPEAARVAEFTGRTVIRSNEWLSLASTWRAAGAEAFAVSGFSWKLSGVTYSSSNSLYTSLGAGTYPFQLAYTDFLGRSYAYSGSVQVLTPPDYSARIVTPVAARLPLM